MFIKRILCLVTLVFCFCALSGQNYRKIDSLKQSLLAMPALNGTDSDTLRLNAEQQIGNLLFNFSPDSAAGWYLLSADTSFNPDRIRKYPGRANIIAGLLLSAGSAFNNMGDYDKSIEYCERALKVLNETGNKAGKSKCFMNLGNSSVYKGDYKSAAEYFGQSMVMAEETGNKKGVSDCLSNLGVISSDLGDYLKATEYYERSLSIRTELNDKTGISSCLINLGVISMYKGDYPESIDYFERALTIDEELNDKRLISFCLMNLGGVTMYQGNYTKAIEYDQRSLDLKREMGDKKGESQCLLYIAATYFNMREPQKAIDYYRQSIEINEQIGDKILLSYCHTNLGNIYYELGDFTRSDESFSISLKIAEELNDKRNISLCLSRMSYLAYGQGKLTEALDYIERAIQINRELGLMSDLSENLIINAKLFIYNNTPDKALPLFNESREIVFRMLKDNFSILSEAEKEDYVNKIKGVFSDIHYFNNNFGFLNDSLPGVCYNNELILKGLLLKSTSAVLNAVYGSSDPGLKESYLSLKQLRNSIAGLQGAVSEEEKAMAAELVNKANDQEKKLVKLSSEFAGIQNLFGYKWEDVKNSLKTGEAAIEFVVFTQGIKNDTVVYAALVITPETPYPKTIRLFPESDIQSAMGKATGTGYKYVNSLYGANSTTLFRLIWQPLEQALKGIHTVYYAPVGVLNKISFAALSKEPGKMLCDIYNLQQVGSTGKLIGKSNDSEIKMSASVFGGIDYNPDTVNREHWQYLPGTLREKEIIENQFKKNRVVCTSFSGKDAKEEYFKALFDSTDAPSILHVSTHGFFYPDPETVKKEAEVEVKVENGELDFRGSNGFGNWMFLNNKNPMMRSGLVFAGANRVWSEDWGRTDNEGVLTAYEVSNMNMRNTDLVVLSACETGLGDIRGSEGVYGLQRAFKMAGVKYIIMSLWQVPDKETVEFMELFYKKLLKAKDVRASFNETQNEMRKKYDPYYWGAFVLVE